MELTQNKEDYLEAIYDITKEKGYVRVKDISSRLNVKPPSVSEMLRKLDEQGFLRYEKYGGTVLTDKGRRVGKATKGKHDMLAKFLKIIRVPEHIAEEDACGMEHHLNPKTVEQITKFISFVEHTPLPPKWLKHFEIYCKKGDVPECDRRED